MVRARRQVLDAGHFDVLRDAVIEKILPGTVLDVGCGEGFYTRPLNGHRDWVGGVDLSKTAVRFAARRARAIRYAVANAFNLPVRDDSISTVVSVFGPIAGSEFRRVLRPSSGQAVVVAPGPQHLAELKDVVFDEARPHRLTGPRGLEGHLHRAAVVRVTYTSVVKQPDLSALLSMTPYTWQVSDERKTLLAATPDLRTTFDFLIVSFRHWRDLS